MVRPHGVHLLDLVAERHRLVRQQLDKLVRCALSCEQLELFVDRAYPGENHSRGDLCMSDECVFVFLMVRGDLQ